MSVVLRRVPISVRSLSRGLFGIGEKLAQRQQRKEAQGDLSLFILYVEMLSVFVDPLSKVHT